MAVQGANVLRVRLLQPWQRAAVERPAVSPEVLAQALVPPRCEWLWHMNACGRRGRGTAAQPSPTRRGGFLNAPQTVWEGWKRHATVVHVAELASGIHQAAWAAGARRSGRLSAPVAR